VCSTYYSGSVIQRITTPCVGRVAATWVKWPATVSDQSNNDVLVRDSVQECSNIDSLSLPNGGMTTGLTTFVQEACETVSVNGAHYRRPTDLSPQSDLQEVSKYYARPRLLKTSTVVSTRTNLWSMILSPQTIFLNASGNSDRIRGAYGARYTLVFTLEVSCSAFHQGMLALAFQYGDNSVNGRFFQSCRTTNLPHVRLDLSNSTMATLRVPFMSTDDFRVISDPITYGFVAVSAILPVEAITGVSPAVFKVYYHIEDLELFGVNPYDITQYTPPASFAALAEPVTEVASVQELSRALPAPPSTSPFSKLKRSGSLLRMPPAASILQTAADVANVVAELRDITTDMVGNAPYTPQIEFQSGLSPVTAEFEAETHPYSSGLHAASRTLKWLSYGIPSISSIAGPTSWALGKAAGVLRYFGYSRPSVTDPPQRVWPTNSAMEHNVDVPSNAIVMAPFSDNRLAVTTNFTNSDVDEMSMKFVLSQYNQLCFGRISTTDTTGTFIYGCPVTPYAMFFRAPSAKPYVNVKYDATSPVALAPTGIAWLGSMFKYWRGGVKYRFTFAKTKMHAGRVAVSFVPASDVNNLSIEYPGFDSVGQQIDGHVAVFDLRDGNVFEFEVPYPVQMAFLPRSCKSGSVAMTIIDPLISSPVTNGSISFLVEVCAANDFEFAFPAGITMQAVNDNPVEQSGLVQTSTKSNICETTMGECITSLKQLIMIPKSFNINYLGKNNMADLAPWYYHPAYYTAFEMTSYGGNLASAYTFVRGGTDYHFYVAENQSAVELRAFMRDADYPITDLACSATSVPFILSNNRNLHFRAPSYQPTTRIHPGRMALLAPLWSLAYNALADNFPTANFSTSVATFSQNPYPSIFPRVNFNYTGTTGATILFKRQAADDAMMCNYIGPPVVKYGVDVDVLSWVNTP